MLDHTLHLQQQVFHPKCAACQDDVLLGDDERVQVSAERRANDLTLGAEEDKMDLLITQGSIPSLAMLHAAGKAAGYIQPTVVYGGKSNGDPNGPLTA